ncbi:hypothetical protein [Nocardiopsis aegyptia]|uniref:Uncharacterized protein n=1 Tax=Nocardiopsis aegyptia TaxID=220378 RepID=A0A7Z0ESL1_9ACTN|nr:hypothetical protein [Nocardiopsis aegyptia]NYJ36580.1 hypothetical protein [Nocardiopsis aegyptia]
MCQPDTRSDHSSGLHVYDPGLLSQAQCEGDACVACHTKWPRPRRVLGVLPDGGPVFGCDECASIIGAESRIPAREVMVAAR